MYLKGVCLLIINKKKLIKYVYIYKYVKYDVIRFWSCKILIYYKCWFLSDVYVYNWVYIGYICIELF